MQKAAIVILVLAVGVGGAMLFRKTPGDEPQVSDALVVREQNSPGGATGVAAPDAKKKQGVPLPAAGRRLADGNRGAPRDDGTGKSLAVAAENSAGGRGGQVALEGNAMRLPPAPPPSFSNSVRPPLPRLSEFEDKQRGHAKRLPYSSRPPEGSTARTANPIVPARPGDDPQEQPELRQHVIVNGDTLERIARRYLGDPSRAGDVLDWNRDVLQDANVLPLGCAIKIPPRRSLPRRLPRVTTAPVTEVGGNPTYDLVPLPRDALLREG